MSDWFTETTPSWNTTPTDVALWNDAAYTWDDEAAIWDGTGASTWHTENSINWQSEA